MSYEIITIDPFDRQLKRLIKRYVSLKEDLIALRKSLKENPQQGESLGKNCYKIHLAITSKNKGKSGVGRVITHILVENDILLDILVDEDTNEGINLLLKPKKCRCRCPHRQLFPKCPVV